MNSYRFYLEAGKVKCCVQNNKGHSKRYSKGETIVSIIQYLSSIRANTIFNSKISDLDWEYKIANNKVILEDFYDLKNANEDMKNFIHVLEEKRRKTNKKLRLYEDKKFFIQRISLMAVSVALASSLFVACDKIFKNSEDEDSYSFGSFEDDNACEICFDRGSQLDECQNFFESHEEEDMLIKKYSEYYGIDYNLIRAIAYQESSGNHNIKEGSAIGIMQIEKVNIGETVSCKNFKTGEIDKVKITKKLLRNKEMNIKIGTMLFRDRLKRFNTSPLLSLQAYNFGPTGMKNILELAAKDNNVDYSYYINNQSETGWLEYRKYYNGGDKEYCENVLRYCTDKIIIYDENGNKIVYEIIPTKENKKIM